MKPLGVLFFVVALLFLYSLAHAEEHRHGDEVISGAVGRFYEGWKQPNNPANVSCCNKADCYPVEARMRGGVWFFKHRETGNWLAVPKDRVELDRDNPDGRNHVCAAPDGRVFCFIAGGGT